MGGMQTGLPPVVDGQTKVLILGSMPGVQSLEKQQYYGNPRNHFWPIMGELFQVDIPANYEERLQLLHKHHVGLWDVIKACERKGSLDSAIKNEVPNDFDMLFKKYPQIQAVLFNGAKAYDVFQKKVGFELLQERSYFKMPSTSPVPGKHIPSFEEKVQIYEVLKKFL